MQGTALARGVPQTITQNVDGQPCERVGVTVTRSQVRFFGGVISSGPSSFTVHSVARYSARPGKRDTSPALVALNQSTCKAIDSANGHIYLIGNNSDPGIAYSDSNGPSCSTGNPIVSGGSSGQVCSQSSTGRVGEIAWYEAPESRAKDSSVPFTQTATCGVDGTSSRYVGRMYARPQRITRTPVDSVYHCLNAPVTPTTPLCVPADDPIQGLTDLSNASLNSAPPGYTTFNDCAPSAPVTLSGNTWVDCAGGFTVAGTTVSVSGGSSIIFRGAIKMGAGGTFAVNTDPSVMSGLPAPSVDTTTQLIINSTAGDSFKLQSSGAVVSMAQTMIYSRGSFALGGGPTLRWSPPKIPPEPAARGLGGLLWWSESNVALDMSGNPVIVADGLFFHPNGNLGANGGPNNLVDLTNVQMWVDRVALTGSPTLKLKANPATSIKTSSSGSSLIR
jgi:hypothetical protein